MWQVSSRNMSILPDIGGGDHLAISDDQVKFRHNFDQL